MTISIVGAAMALMWWFTSVALNHSFDEIGRAIIEDDLGEYSVVYEQSGAEGVASLFRAGGHDGHDQILKLISPSGETILNVRLTDQPQVDWPDIPKASSVNDGVTWNRHQLSDGTTLTMGHRILPDNAELWFGRTNAKDLEAVSEIHQLILLAMAITTVLSVGPILWFAGRVLRPVQSLIASAKGLASGDGLENRLQPSASIPELREFSEVFNESLDRVQRLTEELEAANDQLAHELRTPIARIRGNVERILSNSENDSAVQEDAAKAISEIERTTSLIQSILTIRAGYSGAMKVNLESVSLCALVADLFDLYSASAEEKELAFLLSLPDEDVSFKIDSQRVRQALCNLLDNALAYTPRKGKVEIGLTGEADYCTLFVRDNGPGVAQADRDRIWRRFMRGTNASADVPGIGLGLNLVRAIATAHKGEAGYTELSPGSEFWLRLPIESGES